MKHTYKKIDKDGTVECTKCGLRNSDISREDYIKCTPATPLMQLHPGMVEEVISMLRHMEIDGETMQHIIESVGLEDQMTRQLVMISDSKYLNDLIEEKNTLK